MALCACGYCKGRDQMCQSQMSSGKAFPVRVWIEKGSFQYNCVENKDDLFGWRIWDAPQEYVHSAILQEKDKEIERTKLAADMYCDKLEAEVKKLRAALEWYSDLEWRPIFIQFWPFTRSDKISRKAREALAGGKDE